MIAHEDISVQSLRGMEKFAIGPGNNQLAMCLRSCVGLSAMAQAREVGDLPRDGDRRFRAKDVLLHDGIAEPAELRDR